MMRVRTNDYDTPDEQEELLDVVERLLTMDRVVHNVDGQLERLDQALQDKAREDLPGLIDDVFRSMLSFDTRFLYRAQWAATDLMDRWMKNHQHSGAKPPDELTRDHLPRLVRIENHLVDLIDAYARTKRVLGLADQADQVRSGATKLREALRRLAQPVTPLADKDDTQEDQAA